MSPRKKRFIVIGLALLCVLGASVWLAWSPGMLWLAKRDATKKYADMQDAETLNVALAPDVRQINGTAADAGSGEQDRITAVVDGYRFSFPAARYQRLPGQYVDFDSGKLTVRCLGVLDLTGEFAKAATDDSAVGQYLAKTDPFQILVDAFKARPKDIEQQASFEALNKHLALLLIKTVLMPIGAGKHWERFDTGKYPGIIAGDTSMRGIMVTVYLPGHRKFADILIRPKGDATMTEVYQAIGELDVAPQGDGQHVLVEQAKRDIAAISTAVEAFYLEKGRYPTDEEGLGAVSLKGNSDPWGRPYRYELIEAGIVPYEISSLGADGRVGGVGQDADITSAAMDE